MTGLGHERIPLEQVETCMLNIYKIHGRSGGDNVLSFADSMVASMIRCKSTNGQCGLGVIQPSN